MEDQFVNAFLSKYGAAVVVAGVAALGGVGGCISLCIHKLDLMTVKKYKEHKNEDKKELSKKFDKIDDSLAVIDKKVSEVNAKREEQNNETTKMMHTLDTSIAVLVKQMEMMTPSI